MVHSLVSSVHARVKACGFVVSRTCHTLEHHRQQVLGRKHITAVLDVGANTGQYARWLREGGWASRILSFEPQSVPFHELAKSASGDTQHDCWQIALGAANASSTINTAQESATSSLLTVRKNVVAIHPGCAISATENVRLARLDSLRDECRLASHRFLLKIDTQGYELEVLKGAAGMLDQVEAIEVELSFVPIYEGQPLYVEICSYLSDAGFRPIWIERGFIDPRTRDMLQCDALFVRA